MSVALQEGWLSYSEVGEERAPARLCALSYGTSSPLPTASPCVLLLTGSWVLWDGGMEQPLLQQGLAEGKQVEYPLARLLES